MKRITFVKKEFLSRQKGGYFKEDFEIHMFRDYTDSKLKKELDELNKNAKTRFFEIDGDFNLNTEKGKANLVEFLGKNYKIYSWYYQKLIQGGIDNI